MFNVKLVIHIKQDVYNIYGCKQNDRYLRENKTLGRMILTIVPP